jgi:hypothetical protein
MFGSPKMMTMMLKGFIPVVEREMKKAILDEETRKNGKLIYRVMNEASTATPDATETIVTIWLKEGENPSKETLRVNLQQAVQDKSLLGSAFSSVEEKLEKMEGLAMIGPMLKDQLGDGGFDIDMVLEYLPYVTDYLTQLGMQHGGAVCINLSVASKKKLGVTTKYVAVETQLFQPGNPYPVQISKQSLGEFIEVLLNLFLA